jgi:hypothetical protein
MAAGGANLPREIENVNLGFAAVVRYREFGLQQRAGFSVCDACPQA